MWSFHHSRPFNQAERVESLLTIANIWTAMCTTKQHGLAQSSIENRFKLNWKQNKAPLPFDLFASAKHSGYMRATKFDAVNGLH